MASVVDICNLALSHIGDEGGVASISPPDGSVQAAHCQRFYPIARDALLQQHTWGFATQRKPLALLATDELPAEWAFAYAYPACLRMVAVYPPSNIEGVSAGEIFDSSEFMARATAYPFTVETLESGAQVIYTNVEEATGIFVRLVSDSAKFSALFVVALARLLAAYLAGALIKGNEGMKIAKAQLEWFEKIDGPRAKMNDAVGKRDTTYDTFTPSSLKARQ